MSDIEWKYSEETKYLTYGLLKEVVSEVPKSHDTIALHGGLPPEECFPISGIEVSLYDGTRVEIPASICQQQYNVSPYGYEPLRSWCSKHTKQHHKPRDLHRVMVTDSTTHGLDMITSLLLNPGDAILIEEYTYSHFVDCVAGRKRYDAIPVPMDEQGIVPQNLEDAIMHRMSTMNGHGRAFLPKVLYMIPTAQNPTGACLSPTRAKEIYDICSKYDIYIVEDDPYYCLQFNVDGESQPGDRHLVSHSLLPLDIDGRVIRFDSFAKFLAPGFRLSWVTAESSITEKMAMRLQSETLGANMLSQGMVASILHAWGAQGLDKYLQNMQRLYARKAKILADAMEQYMSGLAEWSVPQAGMFMVCLHSMSLLWIMFGCLV